MPSLEDRIAAVDLGSPRVDRLAADAAVATHVAALGLAARPVRWIDDIAAIAAPPPEDAPQWLRARSHARVAARAAARELGWDCGDAQLRPLVALWEAVEEAVRLTYCGLEPIAPWLREAVLWERRGALQPDAPAIARWSAAAAALVDAYVAGAGFLSVGRTETLVVARPRLAIDDGRLHNDAGPAIEWPGGVRHWFWRGVRVPQLAIEAPRKLTAVDVAREQNQERRRILLERMGFERYARTAGGRVVARDRYGRLWRCRPLPGEREPLFLVEVENSTPEPDGSRRRYFLRVPPTTHTPHEAVAWSFGLLPAEYQPLAES